MNAQQRMDEFFATHSYDRADDWRKTPATAVDPIDDGTVVSLKSNPNHVPAGSPEGGQFASDGGPGATRTVVVGHGTKRTEEEYKAFQTAARTELDRLGMPEQKLEFTFGDSKPITELADIAPGAKEAGHFSPRTGRGSEPGLPRVYKDGIISINLDTIQILPQIRSIVDHEASHARFHFAVRTSQRIQTYINDNFASLRDEGRGVSSYASAWWVKAHDGTFMQQRTAVNETLAEIHAHGKFIDSPALVPHYRSLDTIVRAVWAKNPHP